MLCGAGCGARLWCGEIVRLCDVTHDAMFLRHALRDAGVAVRCESVEMCCYAVRSFRSVRGSASAVRCERLSETNVRPRLRYRSVRDATPGDIDATCRDVCAAVRCGAASLWRSCAVALCRCCSTATAPLRRCGAICCEAESVRY